MHACHCGAIGPSRRYVDRKNGAIFEQKSALASPGDEGSRKPELEKKLSEGAIEVVTYSPEEMHYQMAYELIFGNRGWLVMEALIAITTDHA
jgi:hypothetical protein